MSKKPIVLLYEDEERTQEIVDVLKKTGANYELVNLSKFDFNLFSLPHKDKLYYNRVSACSFFRRNWGSPYICKIILKWLSDYGCIILNGPNALELEISKAAQINMLRKFRIRTPKTFVCAKKEGIQNALMHFDKRERIIIKPNQGGSGKYVYAFPNPHSAKKSLPNLQIESGDGLFILQSYVSNNNKMKLVSRKNTSQKKIDFAYRLEIIGGKVLYVIRIDSTKGFDLCPCDAKRNDERFEIFLNPEDELPLEKINFEKFALRCLDLCKYNGIDLCAIEFKIDEKGFPRAYDINTNTNYNRFAEEKAQKKYGKTETVPGGINAIVNFLLEKANE